MMRALALAALALAASGCSLLASDCLYDDTGCALPGDWRLVSIDGAPATGSMEIATGFVDRQTYAVLPTGNEEYPTMRGPSPANYSLDPDEPQQFDLDLWRMEVPAGVVIVDMDGRVDIDGDRMTYRVLRGQAVLIRTGGSRSELDFPRLTQAGTVFEFRR